MFSLPQGTLGDVGANGGVLTAPQGTLGDVGGPVEGFSLHLRALWGTWGQMEGGGWEGSETPPPKSGDSIQDQILKVPVRSSQTHNYLYSRGYFFK